MATMTSPRNFRGMRWMALALLVAVSSTLALTAWAFEHGPHGGMGPGFGAGMMSSPEHMGRRVDHMLDGLNATDQQRGQVKQIVQAAATDLRQQADQRRALRERAMQIFAAPTVDANAAEQVRQQMLAQHDQASKRMLTAMLDISRVLTPEQRAKMAENMKARGDRMRERHERMLRNQPKS
jgi:Spy/CpxP family protein refolding chaperone